MDQAQREQFRRQLLQRQRDLEAIRASADEAAAVVTLDQSRVGRLSRMDALQGQAMAQATRRRRAIELGRIEAALARLDSDEWGCCDDCGEPIALARLQLDPTHTQCVNCAEAREQAGPATNR
ncbi:MAG: TraR/DksA C4-type zinc finger protein [Wenzhouxiangellaceae bacterium]